MNANTTKTILGGLLPFMTNPATIALVGAGAVALTVYSMFSDDDEAQDNGKKTVPNSAKRLPAPLPTRNPTVREPLPTADAEALPQDPEQVLEPSPEDEKKEMIRRAMSELGKRSGAARRKKAEENES